MSQSVRDVAFLKSDDPVRRTSIVERASQTTGLLSGEYFSPRESDNLGIDIGLTGGSYDLVTVTAPLSSDNLAIDVGLSGGAYLPVVVAQNASDSLALDVALSGGLYLLVVRPAPLESEQATLNGTLLSGAAVTTVKPTVQNEQTAIDGTFLGSNQFSTVASPNSVGGLVVNNSAGPLMVTSNASTVFASGGAAPYTYAWEAVSNPSTITIVSPTASATTFKKSLFFEEVFGTFRCKVTDNLGNVAYTNNVLVDLEHTSGL
jgi:hypothetical protein